LTGGGSGGHITPLLSLAHELKSKSPSCQIIYIGHKGDKFDNLQRRYNDFDFLAFVNGGKFRRYHGESLWSHLTDWRTILLNIRDFFRVLSSTAKAWRILYEVKPDVVFSKGGFVAVPVGIATWLRGIPIVTHDSDSLPGLANRIVGRWAAVHATGMPAEFYDYPKDKSIYTGIPIDRRIKQFSTSEQRNYKKSLGIEPDSLVLLIAGGGLGSRNINQKIIAIAPKLLNIVKKLNIIHLTGQANEEEVAQQYKTILQGAVAKRVSILGFSSEFYKYLEASDLIVSRAGATAIAEFAAAHKACILIPSSFLTGGHQLKNAAALQKIGAVEVAQEDVSSQKLLDMIVKLLEDAKNRKILGNRLSSTAKLSAASELADILLGFTNKQNK